MKPLRSLLIGLLGLGVALVSFAMRGSPLYQATTLWQAYNSLFGPPFALWLWDRWGAERRPSRSSVLLDAAVVGLVAVRSLALVPLVSGHATFFVYILGTAQQRETRALSGMALIAASVIKLWAWHDWPSLVAGGLVGAGAAWLFRRLDAAHATAIED